MIPDRHHGSDFLWDARQTLLAAHTGLAAMMYDHRFGTLKVRRLKYDGRSITSISECGVQRTMKPTRRRFMQAAAGTLAAQSVGRSSLMTPSTVLGDTTAEEDARLQKARRDAAHRPRRVIYNDDGCAVWGTAAAWRNYGKKVNDTPESFLGQRMAQVLETHVDSVYFCTTMWDDRFSHVPQVGEFVTESLLNDDPIKMRELCLGFKQLADGGQDAMQLTLDFCRQHKLEFMWSYRVNDIHDAIEIRRLATFKRENPQLLLGQPDDASKGGQARWWTALDFAAEPVRQRRLDIIADVLDRYDVDGIDLDFCRTPIFFRSTMQGQPATPDEIALMSDLVRKIRCQVLAASRRRGRPVLLSARTPVTLERSLYVGMDVEGWLREGLLDVLVPGQGYVPLTMPAKELVELGHQYDVPVYPCICGTAKTLRTYEQKPEIWRAAASNLFSYGADGVMVFNLFPDEPSETLRTIGDPSLAADRMFGIDLFYSGSDVDHVIPREGTLPVAIQVGTRVHLKPFPVGDDLAAAEKAGQLKSIELRVRINNLRDQPVSLSLNGHDLDDVVRRETWLETKLPVVAVNRGLNQLSLLVGAAGESATDPLSVADVQLWVRYNG